MKERKNNKTPPKNKPAYQLPDFPLTVGDHYRTGGRPATISYKFLEKYGDMYGWHPVEKALPLPLDLVRLRTDREEKNGWYTGSKTNWEGYRLDDDETVIAWKRIE